MARVRARWVVVGAVVAAAAFALIVGGFLWPRPQFEEGRAPWTLGRGNDSLPAGGSSAAESLRPGSTRELEPAPAEDAVPE